MTVDVTTAIVIDRPLAKVFDYASDPEHTPEWYANIRSAEWKTPPPLQVGSRFTLIAHLLSRILVYTYEITELVPGDRLVMRTEQGSFPMETTYTWAALTPDSTRMTLRNRGRPKGFSRLITPVIRSAVRRANTNDLARLKAAIEST